MHDMWSGSVGSFAKRWQFGIGTACLKLSCNVEAAADRGRAHRPAQREEHGEEGHALSAPGAAPRGGQVVQHYQQQQALQVALQRGYARHHAAAADARGKPGHRSVAGRERTCMCEQVSN